MNEEGLRMYFGKKTAIDSKFLYHFLKFRVPCRWIFVPFQNVVRGQSRCLHIFEFLYPSNVRTDSHIDMSHSIVLMFSAPYDLHQGTG